MRHLTFMAALILGLSSQALAAAPASRYLHHGDGRLSLSTNKSGASFRGAYRLEDGSYDDAAIRKINAVFNARCREKSGCISMRLIEFIDYIQDRFDPTAHVTITSGYRSPRYNTALRNSGKLAAKASLHQYGMAADLWIRGVPSQKIWEFVKELGFGGAGFYHGKNVHLDVGPARSWDETTSGVGTDISEDNKLIAAVVDMDIYHPGEELSMSFIRMTAFPIGVHPEFTLERRDAKGRWKKALSFRPALAAAAGDGCPKMRSIEAMADIRWRIPEEIEPGAYRVRAGFCDNEYEGMPSEIATPEFEVQR